MNSDIIDMEIYLDFLKSLGVIIASCVAIWGINSWRREAKWKRKYELAEEVLALLYESHQAIRTIRFPISYSNEGKTRDRKDSETQKESEIYDRAFIARERFNNNDKALRKLNTIKFRFIALYGKQYEQYFDVFSKTINKIFTASDSIAMVERGDFRDDPETMMKIRRESQEIIYGSLKYDDIIEMELQDAINEIEKKCRSVIGKI